jgi:hypothetical protein
MVEDQEMAGAETGVAHTAEEVSGDESEDLEGESSGSEEEDLGEEEEEAMDGDEAMEVDDAEKPTNGVAAHHQVDEVMAH